MFLTTTQGGVWVNEVKHRETVNINDYPSNPTAGSRACGFGLLFRPYVQLSDIHISVLLDIRLLSETECCLIS